MTKVCDLRPKMSSKVRDSWQNVRTHRVQLFPALMGVSPKWVKSKKRRKNTPGTAGGPGGRDRTLAVKSRKNVRKITFFLKKINLPKKIFFLHIFSSYTKILGEKLFRTWEIPRSVSKAKDGGKRGEREREKD